ncbi:MAG: adenylyl-sulfate kinase [archaeon]
MSFALWITGLPGSGKSRIAKELNKKLKAQILRLDEIRQIITPKPNYSKEEREYVYRTLAYMAYILVKNNINIIVDATDNLNIGRQTLKKLMKDVFVVQLKCPVEICEERECKRKDNAGVVDLYERAKKGMSIPGSGQEYIEEKNPFILIETDKINSDLAASIIYQKIKKFV